MSDKPNTRLIGAFVVGAVALIVLVFLVFGSGKFFQETNKWVIFFHGNVNGLKVGAPVKVRGVEIGSVTNIRGLLDEKGDIYVEVIIETIDAALDAVKEWAERVEEMSDKEVIKLYIERGFRAQLQSQSMVTGQLYVRWDFFPESPAILVGLNPDYPEIPSVPTTTEEFQMALRKGLNTMSKVPVLEITNSLLYTLNGLDSLIRSAGVSNVMTEMSRTLRQANGLMKRLENRVDPLYGNLEGTSDGARQTLNRMENLLQEIQTGVANDRYELRLALRQFTEANRSLRLLAEYLQENPRSIIFGKD
ncbi:MAG: MCE family protein [Calditrichia bacterium]|nr:MCE family protein [Calditrichia bacterium]